MILRGLSGTLGALSRRDSTVHATGNRGRQADSTHRTYALIASPPRMIKPFAFDLLSRHGMLQGDWGIFFLSFVLAKIPACSRPRTGQQRSPEAAVQYNLPSAVWVQVGSTAQGPLDSAAKAQPHEGAARQKGSIQEQAHSSVPMRVTVIQLRWFYQIHTCDARKSSTCTKKPSTGRGPLDWRCMASPLRRGTQIKRIAVPPGHPEPTH
jgi:hypothetical protein